MGEPRFFARTHFPMAPNQKPKWHRIESVRSGEYGLIYRAVCGYQYEFTIFREPALRPDVRTKTLRCKDCDRKHEKEQQ